MLIMNTLEKLASSNILKDLYIDLAKPGVTQVGIALGNIFQTLNVLLMPLKYLNLKADFAFKKNLEKLRIRLADFSPEDISPIPPEIGVPVLEKLFYTSNEDLANLFINLLGRASRKNEAHLAHPNFVRIVTCLSPDEARIINHIKGGGIICCDTKNRNNV